jgi:hypothetical protein
MPVEGNDMMKRFIQKLVNELIKQNEFMDLSKVNVFFVFGSKHRTAMCDWVYGLKVYTDLPTSVRNEVVRNLQNKIKMKTQRSLQTSICCTDVIFAEISEL